MIFAPGYTVRVPLTSGKTSFFSEKAWQTQLRAYAGYGHNQQRN